jgi:hypothetical protein
MARLIAIVIIANGCDGAPAAPVMIASAPSVEITAAPEQVEPPAVNPQEAFAGGKANNLLARMLEEQLGGEVKASNFAVTFTDVAAASLVGIRQAIEALAEPGVLSREAAIRFAAGCTKGRVTKFQPCLSERLELELLTEALTDLRGAERAIGVTSRSSSS